MAVVSKVYTPANVLQGPVDVYLGVTPPASAVPPVAGTNTLTLDSSGQPPVASTGQIATVTVANGGTGYSAGDTLAVIQSNALYGAVRVLTVSTGVVSTVAVIGGGMGYSDASGLSTTGGTGTGCTITIASITAGFMLGLTEGPASCTITPKFDLIKADQFSAPVAAAFISNTGEIDFAVKEFALVNLQKYFAGLTSATYWSLGAGSTNPSNNFLQVGATNSSAAMTTTLLLVQPNRADINKYSYWMAYKVYIKSAIPMPISRGKEMVIKMKFGMLLDTTRVLGDMAAQFVRGI